MTNTASIETSKQLHELGWRGECEYVWVYNPLNVVNAKWETVIYSHTRPLDGIPAPTFTELWAALPKYIIVDVKKYWLNFSKTNSIAHAAYQSDGGQYEYNINTISLGNQSPTEAAALLLIWTIENGHVNIKETQS